VVAIAMVLISGRRVIALADFTAAPRTLTMTSTRIPTAAPSIVQRATIDQGRLTCAGSRRRRRLASERSTASVPNRAQSRRTGGNDERSGTGATLLLAKEAADRSG